MEKYVLITNLDYVSIGDVRTNTHALVLEEIPPMGMTSGANANARTRRIRGFGTDPAWPTFDMVVPSIEYKLRQNELKIARGGPLLTLWISDSKTPFTVDEFEGLDGSSTCLRVWAVLPARVAQHWTAPNMPGLQWGSPNTHVARTSRW